jgi:hypothetical protein
LQIPCTGAGVRDKGDILFREREYPLWNPKRKAFRLAVSGLNDLPPEWKYLRAALPRLVLLYDLAYFYFRCRFACDSLPLRNFRLLQICTNLPLPAKAALLALAAIYALSVDGD